jgi:hypothetical protein
MTEMNEQDRLLAKFEALTNKSSRAPTIEMLTQMLQAWHNTGEMPQGAGMLSSGEFRALALASGHEELLGRSPVGAFLALDGWLQRWVLETRGWGSFVGSRLGVF